MSHWLHVNNKSINLDQVKWIELNAEKGYALHLGDHTADGQEITQNVPASVTAEIDKLVGRAKPMAGK